MKLSKKLMKLHLEACDILTKDVLSEDEKLFVLKNWHEGATNLNASTGAFFTPPDLAHHLALDVGGDRIVDLCAGIGILSYSYWQRCRYISDDRPNIVCVEINPEYVEVGKKILPEAKWICADVFEIWKSLGCFDCVISNPPFGNIKTSDRPSPDYTGSIFEYKLIDVASHMADYGVFILPQNTAGFLYSGQQTYSRNETDKYIKFKKQTGLHLDAAIGVDTTLLEDPWRGVSPRVEIVNCDFENRENPDE